MKQACLTSGRLEQRGFAQYMQDTFFEFLILHSNGAITDNNDDIHVIANIPFMQPDYFLYHSTHTIAYYSVTYFFTCRHTETKTLDIVFI
ncbi:hypothetical protein D1872_293750 [compost metagenome]